MWLGAVRVWLGDLRRSDYVGQESGVFLPARSNFILRLSCSKNGAILQSFQVILAIPAASVPLAFAKECRPLAPAMRATRHRETYRFRITIARHRI